ncbi:MAG: hypothetical protein M1819_003794 [Sarea resinae]|nr:MAG: hypothetical protein M1819_003794 [Sarea resinae]
MTRYFCKSCGTHMVLLNDGKWWASTGVLDRVEGVVKVAGHIYVGDTKDGGLSEWLLKLDQDQPLKRWEQSAGKSKALPENHWPASKMAASKNEQKQLEVRCHCGGVHFHIIPAVKKSLNEISPSASDGEKLTWLLRAVLGKYACGVCVCSSCRLASGFDINAWCYVPKIDLFATDGGKLDISNAGTLTKYHSSESKDRYFCGTCGATVFYEAHGRPDIIEPSIGLLRTESGARADDWLEYRYWEVSHADDAANKALIAYLLRGMKEFAKKTGKDNPAQMIADLKRRAHMAQAKMGEAAS